MSSQLQGSRPSEDGLKGCTVHTVRRARTPRPRQGDGHFTRHLVVGQERHNSPAQPVRAPCPGRGNLGLSGPLRLLRSWAWAAPSTHLSLDSAGWPRASVPARPSRDALASKGNRWGVKRESGEDGEEQVTEAETKR